MSNTWLNVRFGTRHLQILMFSHWRHSWPISFRANPYQRKRRAEDPDWRWFELMELRWPW